MSAPNLKCDGRCCCAFTLRRHSRAKLQRSYDAELRVALGELFGWVPPGEYWWPPGLVRVFEILSWWPWMVHLGAFEGHPYADRPGPLCDYYTCTEFVDGRCRDYGGLRTPCEWDGVECDATREADRQRAEWRAAEPDLLRWKVEAADLSIGEP